VAPKILNFSGITSRSVAFNKQHDMDRAVSTVLTFKTKGTSH